MTDDDLKALFVTLRDENAVIREENAAAHAETRRHFDVSTEGLKKEIRVVADAVAQLDEKMDREIETAREEMRRGFEETQAMIKFSHAELDRRVSALEQSQRSLEKTVSDLQGRVERLETTH